MAQGRGVPAVSPQQELIRKALDLIPDAAYQASAIVPGNADDNTVSDSQKFINSAYSQIIQLRQIIDIENHITSKLVNIDGKKVWLRFGESGELKDDSLTHQQDLQINYARMFYAYLIAATTIGKLYGFSEDEGFLEVLERIQTSSIADIFNQIRNGDEHSIKEAMERGKAKLVEAIQQAAPATQAFKTKPKDISKMLDRAKDWAGMEDDTYTVITIMGMAQAENPELRNHKLIMMDEPCTKLTEAQKAELDDHRNQQWFLNLKTDSAQVEDSFEQRLLSNYIPRIRSEKCVVPSQLRSIAPACRNFYKQTSAVVDVTSNKIETFAPVFHSGTDAYLSPQAHLYNGPEPVEPVAKKATINHFEQVKENTEADVLVIFNLNSHLADKIVGPIARAQNQPYQADDSKLLALSKEAAKELEDKNIYAAKVCANGFRRVPGLERDDLSALDKVIGIIENNLESLSHLDAYRADIKKIRKAISSVNRSRRLHLIDKIVDNNLEGLTIISKFVKLCDLNNQFANRFNSANPGAVKLKTTACKFNCASGDNRTGIVEVICATDRFNEYFNTSCNRRVGKEIALTIAKFEHVQLMKGNQGCTFGTESIRYKSMGSLPKRLQYLAYYLSNVYSDLKNIFHKTDPVDPNKKVINTPWANAPKVRQQIINMGNQVSLTKQQREYLNDLKKAMIHELRTCEEFSRDENRKAKKRYELSNIATKTHHLLKTYETKVKNISTERNPELKKSEFDDFVKQTKAFEKDTQILRGGKKIAMVMGTVLGALVGGVLGAAIFGVAGFFVGGHVGAGVGALYGVANGLKWGSIGGAIVTASLVSAGWTYSGNVGMKSLLFSPKQKAASNLTKEIVETLDTTRKVVR